MRHERTTSPRHTHPNSGNPPIAPIAQGPRRLVAAIRSGDLHWTTAALCANYHPWLADAAFFPEGHDAAEWMELARRVCQQCPVIHECREWALNPPAQPMGEPHGMWGGLTPQERRQLIEARARQARGVVA